MAQVLKPEVRDRITAAAARLIADRGYAATPMSAIAAEAGTATANLYRYFPDKAALLDAVVPSSLAERHDALLDARVGALMADPAERSARAEALLAFWIEHRLAVTILLDRAAGTPYADYPDRFVARLVADAERHTGAFAAEPHGRLLHLVFDNTRRAIAEILRTTERPDDIRALVEGFWSYQLPGLDGLLAWMAAR